MNTDVRLDFYHDMYRKALEHYPLPPQQLQFTGLPLDCVAKAETENEYYSIVILYNDVPAGFFVLQGWDGVQTYSDNREALLIRAYSINPTYQGKGIAKKSLELLPTFIKAHFPERNEIVLGVNHKNIPAQQVYLKAGFVDRGKRVYGKLGEQFVFHLQIQ
ncbi:GNAT family N-acetyltransferase [Radiobacillus kanasensis]|uniref:GNAT family N-acetyltransferase n=1 Tax=Radiobacillus kanasensis TaxID=2844358 RepID=UPI001E42C2D0|nr:GNAT family protein [Radiobacillus kanasensis]UFT99060.1 GNAT family N-acetyltransferase [Radiobacillus kanasensis]